MLNASDKFNSERHKISKLEIQVTQMYAQENNNVQTILCYKMCYKTKMCYKMCYKKYYTWNVNSLANSYNNTTFNTFPTYNYIRDGGYDIYLDCSKKAHIDEEAQFSGITEDENLHFQNFFSHKFETF